MCPARYQRLSADAGTADAHIGPPQRLHRPQRRSQERPQEGEAFDTLGVYAGETIGEV